MRELVLLVGGCVLDKAVTTAQQREVLDRVRGRYADNVFVDTLIALARRVRVIARELLEVVARFSAHPKWQLGWARQ